MRRASPGKDFEQRVQDVCTRQGMLVVHHGVQVRYMRGGAIRTVRSDLDFRIATPGGHVMFFDAKSCGGRRLSRSAIAPHQMALIAKYTAFRLVAGVLAELRGADAVVWLPAAVLAQPVRGWGVADGVCLGPTGWWNAVLLTVQRA